MARNVYRELKAQMIRKGIKNADVAQALNVCPSTVYKKMINETDFTLSEAIAIKKLLGYKGKLETLFEKSEVTEA